MRLQSLCLAALMIALALAAPSFAAKSTDFGKVKTGANCAHCDLVGFSSPKTIGLNGIDFSGADLTNADLSGDDLRGDDFHGANLSHINLSGSNLTGDDISFAIMNGAILCNTTMPDGTVIYSGC